MKRLLAIAPLLGLAVGLASAAPEPPPLDPAATELAQGNNALGLDIYKRLAARGDGKGNLLFSPYGVANMLGLTYAASGGETAKQINKVTHLKQDAESVCKNFGVLAKACSSVPPPRPRFGATVAEADGKVTVREVAPDSPAAQAGLKAGDVLSQVDGKKVASALDLFHALDLATDSVELLVNAREDGSGGEKRKLSLGRPEPHKSDGGYQLRFTNALWAKKGLEINPWFADQCRSAYNGSVRPDLDFSDPAQAAAVINGWARRESNGKIEELLNASALSKETELVIANLLYFQARWEHRFNDRFTEKGAAFRVSSTEKGTADLMNTTSLYRVYEGAGFQALELPYQGGASMVVLLPKDVDGLPALEKELTGPNLATWLQALDKLEKKRTRVTLPRFNVTRRLELHDTLTEMGLTDLFGAKADYSHMTSQRNLVVSQLVQQATIRVDEYGTEAAAATGVVVIPAAPPEATFLADHPFVFLIREPRTGSVLFLGRVVNPGK